MGLFGGSQCSKQTALLASRIERRRHVALRQSSRGREHLVDLERSEQIYLVIRDQFWALAHSKTPDFGGFGLI